MILLLFVLLETVCVVQLNNLCVCVCSKKRPFLSFLFCFFVFFYIASLYILGVLLIKKIIKIYRGKYIGVQKRGRNFVRREEEEEESHISLGRVEEIILYYTLYSLWSEIVATLCSISNIFLGEFGNRKKNTQPLSVYKERVLFLNTLNV